MPFCEACGNKATEGETMCSQCGAHLRRVETGATDQDTIVAAADSSFSGPRIAGQEISRIVAGAWILVSVLLLCLAESPGAWALVLAPSWIGALFPLIRNADLTAWTESWEKKLLASHVRAREKTGRFARHFTKPLFGGSLFIWRKTQPLADTHLRAGVRITAVVCFTALMVTLLILIGYIVIGVVIAIAIVLFILWALSGGLSQRSEGGSEHPVRSSRPTTAGGNDSTTAVNVNEYRRGYEAGREAGPLSQLGDALFAITNSADYTRGYKDGHQGRDFNPEREDD